MANTYDKGDLVRVTATWTDPLNSDAAIDPSTVAIDVTTPSGTTTPYVYGTDAEVKRDSIGIYYMDLSLTEEGTWKYRWYSTGAAQAAEQAKIFAKEVITV